MSDTSGHRFVWCSLRGLVTIPSLRQMLEGEEDNDVTPLDRMRSLLTPDSSRWQPMLMGLAVCAAAGGAIVAFRPPMAIEALLTIVAFVAWIAGACAMLGYVRWFYASELARAKNDAATPDKGDRT